MKHPFLFWIGYRQLRINAEQAEEVVNLCRIGGYVYRDFSFCGSFAYLVASRRMSQRILRTCRESGIAVWTERERGFPFLLYGYRRRPGIWLGLACFALIVWGSGRVVWDIRIEGEEGVCESAVREQLAECGLRVGVPIASLDTRVIENRVLILSDEISWFSINMSGTVAQVELRTLIPEPKEESYAAANLVASRSGVIEGWEDVRGNLTVSVGDAVSEGELLVGGLYDIEGGGLRYICAKGRIFARTQREFTAEVPLQYQKKVYTGRRKTEKYWIFFEKEIKFFGNTGNSPGTCDTINTVKYFKLPGNVTLPFGIRTVRYWEYELRDARRTREEAVELAFFQLRRQTEEEVPNGFLVRKSSDGVWRDNAYVLHCTANYIENIAVVREIKIEGVS